MRRLAILCFVAGALLLQQQAQLVATGMPWLLALAAAAALVLCGRTEYAARAFLLLAAAATGFAWANTLAQQRLAQRLTPQWEGRDVVVSGVIADLPRVDERATRFLLDVETSEPALTGRVRRIALSWYHPSREDRAAAAPMLQPGERWRLTVRLKRPHGTANPFTFDFERWALERNIGATGYVREKVTPLRLSEFVARPAYLIDRWRAHIRARFAQTLQGAAYGEVLSALAVGEQSGIEPAQWRLFWRSGIGHLISISGLHITMIAGLAGWAASWVWRRSARAMLVVPAQRIAVLAGALAGLSYAVLAGFSVPTQRTVYMLTVVALAWWFGWRTSPSRVLCVALLVVVVADPWAVSTPGFWLSFGAIAAIVYVTAHRPAKASKAALAVRTQIAVTLVLAPALLLMFHQLPLVSPLANAIAIPVVSLIVVPLTLLGAVLPVDALLQAAHAIFAACMSVMQWLTQWPGSVWTRAAPPWWSVALALAGALWLLLPRGFPARWLGVVWLLPLIEAGSARAPPGQAWVSVLDVGQGLAVVVETARHTLLYDAGPRYSEDANAGARIVLPYLRGRGVSRLDGLIVSHADEDHAGGAADVQAEMRAPWLLSSLPAEHALVRGAAKALRCGAGQSWHWDGVRFEMLGPPAAAYAQAGARENALSCVLRVSAGPHSIVLPGDIEAEEERALVRRLGAALHADALVASHHGSKTSSTAEFLSAVRPGHVVFAVGYRNRFRHPHADVSQRVSASGAQMLRSDENGAVELRLGAATLTALGWRQQARRYWRAD